VAIDAAAVRGVTKLPFSTLKSGFPILKSPTNRHHAVPLTLEEFEYAFTNTMSDDESKPCGNVTPCRVRVASYGKAPSRTSTRGRR
jgi:hypothetical protein